jgi:hypothetical protein
MEQPLPERMKTVVQQITHYLIKHPESGDTLENIMMWWIPAEQNIPRLQEVEQALSHLVSEGLMTQSLLPGGKKWYKANPDKINQMTQYQQTLSS